MELTTILNRCHHFKVLSMERARFSADKKSIEWSCDGVKVQPQSSLACHLPAPGYDQLAERRFDFIPLWGFFVFLLYARRRVDCRQCGMVAVEEVPCGNSPSPRLNHRDAEREIFCRSWRGRFQSV
ncbi:MAG TPA: hypothetical protein VHW24_00870 [Bryobacteraceae bacterium]|nr:hypothetical protein [Bryobacteraceae bacterium]